MTYVPLKDRVETMTADGVVPSVIAEKIGISERAVRVHLAKKAGKLSSGQLSEVTGATYRQINHWTVKGYLTHLDLGDVLGRGTQRKGSGSDIMFEPTEVQIVTLVLELIAIGFEVDSAFRVARQLDASGALNHAGTGEHGTAMIVFPHGWKLVKEVS